MIDDGTYLWFESVRVGADGIAEVDGPVATIFVPRTDIITVELRHGSGAQRPVVALVLGMILFVLSILPLIMIGNALRRSEPFPAKVIAAIAFAIPALWLIDLSVRRRWFLRVQTRRGARKILFPKTADQVSAESFLSSCRSRFGYW
jgi:hypothetical protein